MLIGLSIIVWVLELIYDLIKAMICPAKKEKSKSIIKKHKAKTSEQE